MERGVFSSPYQIRAIAASSSGYGPLNLEAGAEDAGQFGPIHVERLFFLVSGVVLVILVAWKGFFLGFSRMEGEIFLVKSESLRGFWAILGLSI